MIKILENFAMCRHLLKNIDGRKRTFLCHSSILLLRPLLGRANLPEIANSQGDLRYQNLIFVLKINDGIRDQQLF